MGHVLFVAGNVAALIASWSLARRLLPRADVFERLLATAAGLPIVVVPTLTALGVLGILTAPFAVVAVAVVAALTAWVAHCRSAPESGPRISAPAGDRPSLARHAELLALGLLLGVLGIQAKGWITALGVEVHRLHWDDFSYHGPMAAHWIQAERLILAPYNYHAYYAGNGELLAAWFMLPTHMVGYAALNGLYFMALVGLSAMQLARRLGAGALGAALAPAIVWSAAPFVAQADSFAAVELGATASMAAAVALSMCGPDRRQLPAGEQTGGAGLLGRTLYVGALVGFAAGAKAVYAPVGALCLLALWLELRPSRAAIARSLAAFALCAVLCGGYWYVRNWVVAGNPLFPAKLPFFEGPLDAEARERTSLWFHWNSLDAAARVSASDALLDWPRAVAYLLLGGYGLTLASLLRPSVWRDPVGRRRTFLLLAGLVMSAVVTFGPFSGSANAKFARIHIRLRFFLTVALLAAPLAVHWLLRIQRARAVMAMLACGLLAWAADLGWMEAALAALCGVGVVTVAAMFARRAGALRFIEDKRATAAMLLAVALLLSVAADHAMLARQPKAAAQLAAASSGWQLCAQVPVGGRMTWFSNFPSYKYFRAFGPRLDRVPVPVESDGRPFVFMHDFWRRYRPTWWDRKPRPRELDRLVDNLVRQDIRYALVMRRNKGKWPPHYQRLRDAPRAREIARRENQVLFEVR